MINVEQLLKDLKKKKIDFFTGVPDSILKIFLKKLKILQIISTKLL